MKDQSVESNQSTKIAVSSKPASQKRTTSAIFQQSPNLLKNHGLIIGQMSPSSCLNSGSNFDVMLSNIQLLTTPVSILPVDGLLRQALMSSEKNLKGNTENNSCEDSSLMAEQESNIGSPSIPVSWNVNGQIPLIASSVPQQIIKLGDLGTNPIILTSSNNQKNKPTLANCSGVISEMSNLSSNIINQNSLLICDKSIKINSEHNTPAVFIINDHHILNALGNCNSDNVCNQKQIEADSKLLNNKLIGEKDSVSSLSVNNLIASSAELISDNEKSNMNTSSLAKLINVSLNQGQHIPAINNHTADGNVEVGYSAHLLSELSDSGSLPSMSSLQVSSVLSGLEPIDRFSTNLQLNPINSSIIDKMIKSSSKENSNPPSFEFVKTENCISDVVRNVATNSKSNCNRYKIVTMRNSGVEKKLFKCESCNFLTLKEKLMEEHFQKIHLVQLKDQNVIIETKEIKCIGCDNVFQSKPSLQVHLIQDHGVFVTEVASIVETISSLNQTNEIDPSKNLLESFCSDGDKTNSNDLTEASDDKDDNIFGDSNNKEPLYISATSRSSGINDSSTSFTTLPSLDLNVNSIICNKSSFNDITTAETPFCFTFPPSVLTSTLVTCYTTSQPESHRINLSPPRSLLQTIQSSIFSTSATNSTATVFAYQDDEKRTYSDSTVLTASITSPIVSPMPIEFLKNASSPFLDSSNETKNTNGNGDLMKINSLKILFDEKNFNFESSNQNDDTVETKLLNKKRARPLGAETIKKVKLKHDLSEIKTEKESNSIRCGISGCALRFKQIITVEYHRQCHVEKSPNTFHCIECNDNNEFTWHRLLLHLWKNHQIDMELYSCNNCGYKTPSHSALENHVRIHGDERPFLCNACGKGFKNQKQLCNHKVIHKQKLNSEASSNHSYVCKICGRKVADARILRLHIEHVHNNRRPYHCTVCNYTAASSSTLRMHSRQHTGEKPFSCDECNYSTADHNSLRRHKKRHSGIKTYQCPHCTYACIQSSTYKSHLKNKHSGMDEGLMFSCCECNFRTIKKDILLAHTATHDVNRGSRSNSEQIIPSCDKSNGNISTLNFTNLESEVVLPVSQNKTETHLPLQVFSQDEIIISDTRESEISISVSCSFPHFEKNN